MLWRKNGKLLKDGNGRITRCDVCPCDTGPVISPCCPDTIPELFWALFSYYQSGVPEFEPPHGCEGLNICGPTSVGGHNVYYANPVIIPFTFGGADPFTVSDTLECWPITIEGRCVKIVDHPHPDRYVYHTEFSIDYGDETSSGVMETCPPSGALDCFLGLPDAIGGRLNGFLQHYDPTSEIRVPDGTTLPHDLVFTVTELDPTSGLPVIYTANLKFVPGASFIFNLCYSWIGCFTNCDGVASWVQLSFNQSSGEWDLTVKEDRHTGFPADDFVQVFHGVTFETSGVSNDVFRKCNSTGAGSMWSLTWGT